MDVIRQLADEFMERKRGHIEEETFIPKAREAAHEIDAKSDRVKFLTHIMEDVTKWIDKHRLACKKTDCGPQAAYRKVSYFLNQELARLDVVVDQDAFTTSERDAMHEKLDTILNELAQIKKGQGIVAQDVEDLKDLMYLGKQKWYRQYVGTVSEWVASGIVEEATAKPLVEAARNLLSLLPALPGL